MKRKLVPLGRRGSGKVRKEIGVTGYGRIVLFKDDSLSGYAVSPKPQTKELENLHSYTVLGHKLLILFVLTQSFSAVNLKVGPSFHPASGKASFLN